MTPELKSLVIEARARIIWGESSADTRAWLVAQGLAPAEAEYIVRQSRRERAKEIRRIGLRNLLTGIGLLLGGTALFMLSGGIHHRAGSRIILVAFFMVLCGVWQVVQGIERLVEGAQAEGSIPDME